MHRPIELLEPPRLPEGVPMRVDQPDCGCIIAAETRVVVFARDDCAEHVVAANPDYAEWQEHGEPVG